MQHAYHQLPEGYRHTETINIQKDKKLAVAVNGLAVLILLVTGVIGHLIVPLFTVFEDSGVEIPISFLKIGVMFVLYALYIIAHEATHGIAMRYFGGGKVRFGFTGLYAYAGSEEDYFDRKAYICIALAPVVLWTIILTIVLVMIPRGWFWVIYFVQISNVAGAAGDFYVTVKTLKKPYDVLVKDTGIEMSYFEK